MWDQFYLLYQWLMLNSPAKMGALTMEAPGPHAERTAARCQRASRIAHFSVAFRGVEDRRTTVARLPRRAE